MHEFSIRRDSIIYSFLAIFVFILFFISNQELTEIYENLEETKDVFISIRDDIQSITESPANLSDQVKSFAVTGDVNFVNNYFSYMRESNGFETELNNIMKTAGSYSYENFKNLKDVVNDFSEIKDIDMRSMKLIFESGNYNDIDIPNEIKSFKLSPEEEKLSRAEKRSLSRDLIFGNEYAEKRQAYKVKIEETSSKILNDLLKDYDMQKSTFTAVAILHEVMIIIMTLFVIFVASITIKMVINPLVKFTKCMNEERPLPLEGTRELQMLSKAYNKLYLELKLDQDKILYKADHDALTGLLNRESFNSITKVLKETREPVGIMMMDIDYFKEINDTYGHEVGDKALKKLATSLRNNFRVSDYLFRYGGDEFCVIFPDIMYKSKAVLCSKIDELNKKFAEPEEGMPAFSISAGISFNDEGYSDELFNQADEALYQTKKRGRKGYSIYGYDEVESI